MVSLGDMTERASTSSFPLQQAASLAQRTAESVAENHDRGLTYDIKKNSSKGRQKGEQQTDPGQLIGILCGRFAPTGSHGAPFVWLRFRDYGSSFSSTRARIR